jgi:two-component system, LuxR family, sensor kinase FixL
MGLTICRSIVQAHGGRVWASPNPAGGAVFHMVLPVAGHDRPVARWPGS